MKTVYTIGYEGTDIDRFISVLKVTGVKCLADVRAIAHSRKRGFSKKTLSERLAMEGIDYIHFIKLGDPKPGREAARAGLYQKFRDIYNTHLDSEDAQSALKELQFAASEKPTCLLCFERDPDQCHRSIVADELTKLLDFEILNLFGDDPGRYLRNANKLQCNNPSESLATA